jgi:hypothetical protein
MKALLAVLVLASCGRFEGSDGTNGSSCTTRQDSVGVFVECSDGTDSFIPYPENGQTGETGAQGEKGDTGDAGINGANGTSCLLAERNISCHNHTKKFKQYLVCPNGEVYLKEVRVSNGC